MRCLRHCASRHGLSTPSREFRWVSWNTGGRSRIDPHGSNGFLGNIMNMKLMAAAVAALFASLAGATDSSSDISTEIHAVRQVREGRDTFRFATFGDEAFWGDGIGLHLAIAGTPNGGAGPGVSPATALAVGLKVDVGTKGPEFLGTGTLRCVTVRRWQG
jgi:hypothetical protein